MVDAGGNGPVQIGQERGAPCPLCGARHAALDACALPSREGGGTIALGSGWSATDETDVMDDLLGTMLGNFRIVRMLGRGGMGTVYLGEHALIGSRVAIKFLHPHLAADPSLVERFFAEAKAANLVGHENLVKIFALSLLPPNRYYLIMEYLEGESLSARMGRPQPANQAIPLLMQACDALEAAHAAGVVHRDLKPENVFLVQKQGSDQPAVKLVDFGIAKLGAAAGSITAAGLAVGTPEYMAPEQWTGSAVDGRADLYALGVIAYALATGRLPFQEGMPLAYYHAHTHKTPPPPREVEASVDTRWEKVILKALAKRPDDRFPDARAMRAALAEVLETRPEPAPRPAETPEPFEPRHQATLEARVGGRGWSERVLKSADLSRGGMFLCAEGDFPQLFSRVRIALLHPEGEVACDADVVRHVPPDQAKAWGMSPGFAVQFLGATPQFKATIDQILSGKPLAPVVPSAPTGDDPQAEAVLGFFRKRLAGDHYNLLGVLADAECGEIRTRARQAQRDLESLSARPLSNAQREQARAALERVQQALDALGNPARRAEYDAGRGNYKGVARCLAAGLTATRLEEIRRAYLASRPKNEGAAHLQVVTANALLANREEDKALVALQAALALDPLNLSIHQKYWVLKRRLAQGGKGTP